MNLRLNDGTTQLNLSDGTYARVVGFAPDSGDKDTTVARIDAVCVGSRSAIIATVNSINNMIERAKARQQVRRGARVYLEIDEGDGWLLRSEIIDGSILTDSNTYDRLSRNYAPITLIVERKNYWESTSETQIPLSNENGTNNTSGLNIYNCNDGAGSSPNKRNNYIEISSSAVSGDLPAPPRIEFTYLSTGSIYEMFLSHNWRSAPATLTHWYEFSGIYSATCSGTSYTTVSSGPSAPSDAHILATISSAQVSKLLGRSYRVLVRLYSSAVSTYIYYPAILELAGSKSYGAPIIINSPISGAYLYDFGQLPAIPPYESAGDPIGAFDFGVRVANMPALTGVDVDYMQLTPVDGYRKISNIGASQNYKLVLDESAGEAKTFNTTPAIYAYCAIHGAPIMLFPGVTQRLYCLWNDYTTNTVSAYGSVKIYYRPRRKTL